MPEPSTETDHAAWGARFGWLAGGILGLILGFALTYVLEIGVLRPRVRDATAAASKAAAVLVPAFFVAFALGGYAFGSRGGRTRYKILGTAAGIGIAALGWALLVLAR